MQDRPGPTNLKHRSREITTGPARTPARAMLRATGLDDAALHSPFIGVANLASDVTPCNVHLSRLTNRVKQGVREARGTPFEFGTITVSDGISMGTEGMKASLVSREVIADSIELVSMAEWFDGLVAVAGCDKNMPGCLMAMARLNIPSVFVYGGTIMPGRFQGRDVNIQDVFEAVGAHSRGAMSDAELDELERVACPGEGSCAGFFTANTMSSAIEALGMALPGDASIPAVDTRKPEECQQSGEAVLRMLEMGITPRDILTREAFENAIAVVSAIGGSTNAVLHLLAISREAEVELDIDDFDYISRHTPYIADMRPGGKYVMADLDQAGGLSQVMKRLLDAGLMHGDTMTVTGKTLRENLEGVEENHDQKVVFPVSSPLSDTGSLVILKGNLAPEGGVIKIAGHAMSYHNGPARVFDREQDAFEAVRRQRDQGRRRGGDSLRRAQGRARHAGDAGCHGGDRGPGARRRRCAHHRRALLRRHPRPDGGPHCARGGRGRAHRGAARRRHDHDGHPQPAAGGGPHRRGAAGEAAGERRAGVHAHDGRAGQVRQAGVVGVRGGRDRVGVGDRQVLTARAMRAIISPTGGKPARR